jgi:plastocyanin
MRRWRYGLLVLLAGILGGLALGWSGQSDRPEALSDHHTIGIHFSRFENETVSVPLGVPVTFELVNRDPIAHEWIVGDADVHRRHRLGTEPYHDAVPTEVTIPAFESRTTVVTFERPGEYAYVCHLPGHEAYGMRGVVRVVGG